MRAPRYLVAVLAIVMITAACGGGGTSQPPGDLPVSPPVTQPPDSGPSPTAPPTIPPKTPPTTPPTTPPVPVTFLDDIAPGTYQVFGADRPVIVTGDPAEPTKTLARLDPAERDIAATGRRAESGGTVWFEIRMTDGSDGWVDSLYLVHQIEDLTPDKPGDFVVSGLDSGQRLNVRSHPGVDHLVVTTLGAGASIETTGRRAQVQGSVWVEIEYSATGEGWVNASYLVPEVVYLADEAPAVYRVTGLDDGGRLNVRKGPGIHNPAIATLAANATDIATTGKRAEVSGGSWRQIELSDGTLGWVSAAFVELQPEPEPAACRPGGDTFCPLLGATRGMTAAFISRAAGLTDDGGRDWFTDDDGSLFEADINRLAAAGIIKGCNPPAGDKVCPDDVIVRGQLAAWTVRAFGVPGTDRDFFVDDDSSIFEDAINAIAAAGITRP